MRKTGEKLQQVFSVLITWGLLLVLFVAYERYFVTNQEAFLKERAFHSLARLAEELNAQVQRARISTKSYVQLAAGPKLSAQELTAFLNLYLKDAWSHDEEENATRESIDAARKCLPIDGLPSALKATSSGLTLTFSCNGNTIYALDLTTWIQDAFQPLGSDFDDVLIADAMGGVLFQKSSELPRITDLKAIVSKTGSDSTAGDKPAGADQPSSNSKGAKEHDGRGDPPSPGGGRFQKFTETSFFAQTTLAGLAYELFTVPIRISLMDSYTDSPWRLVVCGLRLSAGFESDSHAIPYSNVIWATLVGAAIFTLTWPLAKLRYMSNTERFTPKEGWLLGLTILLAATSVTLMLLNASYTSQATREADSNLSKLAGQIKDNFATEMTLAKRQMQQLSKELDPKEEKNILTPNYLEVAKEFPGIYPFFDIAFSVDQTGKQIRKFDVRPAPTPIVSVKQLAYFTRATSDEHWQSETHELDNYYLDPEISITTAQFSPVLAAPFPRASENRIKVQALSVRPISLVEPVLPPGYGFAVIDADCNVLFHSEAFRNKRENFCQESMGTSELRPWLFGESASPVDISYAGRPERAFITSMTPVKTREGDKMPQFATGPAYLVVFRIADYALTLNLAMMLVCAILLGFYALLLMIAIGVYLFLRGPLGMINAPRRMWPCSGNGLKYVQIFAANAAILLFYSIVYAQLYEAPLLALTCFVTCFSILLMIFKLTSPAGTLLRFGLLLITISFIALVGIFAFRNSFEGLGEWRSVFVLFGMAGTVAVLLSGKLHWSDHLSARISRLSAWGKHFATTKFSVAYSLAALTVVTAASIVPCIGCFKFAYDAVSEMALKHAEIELSNSLLARRERIRSFYDALGSHNERIWSAAARRVAVSLDRYDEQFNFRYTGEPKLDSSASQSSTVDLESGKTKSDFTERINVAIERAIARAALVFPTNSLGSEMSKLGVASSEGEEHSFAELAPTQFKLIWNPDSRLRGLTVESEYSKWEGLQWLGRGLVLLLWLVLGVWLTRILRKLLLTDVQTPRVVEAAAWNHVSDIQGNFLVVGLAKSGKSEWVRSIAGLSSKNCFDLSIELKRIISGGSYPNPVDSAPAKSDLGDARRAATGPVVVLDDFEFNIRDRDYNVVRLNLLEHLLYESDCRVVLVSSVDPLYFLTEGAPEVLSDPNEPELAHKLLDRWTRVLSKLERVSAKSPGDREFREKIMDFIRDHPDCREFALRVRRECNSTSMLRKVGTSILDDFEKSDPVTRDWIESTVLDKAGDYYRVLWSGLTAKERLVLYQLALHGWANPKNTGALQQLESKSLIRRMPMYRMINESFRRFVASAGHADEIAEWEKQQKQSTWRVLRLIIIGLAVTVAIWFLHSQAALSQELAGIVAAAATLLTAFSALFGRSGKQTAKSEPS